MTRCDQGDVEDSLVTPRSGLLLEDFASSRGASGQSLSQFRVVGIFVLVEMDPNWGNLRIRDFWYAHARCWDNCFHKQDRPHAIVVPRTGSLIVWEWNSSKTSFANVAKRRAASGTKVGRMLETQATGCSMLGTCWSFETYP